MKYSQIHPVITPSEQLMVGDKIRIVHPDDDMNGSEGIYTGQEYHMMDGVFKYVIVLNSNQKHYFAHPEYVKKLVK